MLLLSKRSIVNALKTPVVMRAIEEFLSGVGANKVGAGGCH